jgi:hypothetical protein
LRTIDDPVEVTIPATETVQALRSHDLQNITVWETIFSEEALLETDDIAELLRYFREGNF